MKVSALTLLLAFAALSAASAADQKAAVIHHGSRTVHAAPAKRVPLALRTLSRRSAAVIASTPCWTGCTTECGWHFQACRRMDRLDFCIAGNNQCELYCLKQCRTLGGPLVSWTDY